MDYQDKLNAAMKELEQSKISKSNYAPPFFNLLLKLGFKVRPYHYNSPLVNFILLGSCFGLTWGLAMWVLAGLMGGDSPIFSLSIALMAGAMFGGLMALYYKISGKTNHLSEWSQL
ncbi:hypothetical protein GCM10011338_37300 [Alteromonas lipolytica]|uniref:Uncharacterized protein n=2 Tax=Alteromonas lipolytica TaxID=1856405 RepID=A0A1E8FIX9_9ALTE|nr:hypothetical protein BFC17_11410 [Alteromonas lipolytica]GGF81575.1 hypothetical protein GCM10011338_37300 [Alteromonas lipolytica]